MRVLSLGTPVTDCLPLGEARVHGNDDVIDKVAPLLVGDDAARPVRPEKQRVRVLHLGNADVAAGGEEKEEETNLECGGHAAALGAENRAAAWPPHSRF